MALHGYSHFQHLPLNLTDIDRWATEHGGPSMTWSGLQTFPRSVSIDTRDPSRIVFWPIEEIFTAHSSEVVVPGQTLAANASIDLSGVGTQLDIIATFKGNFSAPGIRFGVNVFVNGDTEATSVMISDQAQLGPWMPDTDLPGADYYINNTFSTDSDPHPCQALCLADQRCKSWTFIAPGIQLPTSRCCLKDGVPAPNPHAGMTSGVPASQPQLNNTFFLTVGYASGPFPFYADETLAVVRILVDHSIVEGFGKLQSNVSHCDAI